MAYSPSDLADLFRSEIDDKEAPGDGDDADSLWSDSEIYSYMDFAQNEFAKLTEVITDSSTAAITVITVTADNPWIAIDPRIVRIMKTRGVASGYKLQVIKQQDAEQMYMGDDYGSVGSSASWEDSKGTPQYIITDMEKDKGRLVPIPIANDTLQLTVVRLPLDRVTKVSTALEIVNPRHQLVLLDGMKWRAYLKQDADTLNFQLATRFEASFRVRSEEVRLENVIKTKPGRAIRYGGIPMS